MAQALTRSDLLIDNPEGRSTLLLAHGAGAGMDTPFMEHVAKGVAARGARVVRFELDYMRRRRATGKKGPPDKEATLLACFRRAISLVGVPAQELYIGGKSMGGRMASLIADEEGVGGLVCLGYPFHPPGRPEKLRTAHLASLATRALFLQGERDTFGSREEVAGYSLSSQTELAFLPDGDHSFKPRKASGRTEAQNLEEATDRVARFMRL